MMLAPHFTLREFERTSTGLPNRSPKSCHARLRRLCGHILEPLRGYLERPVIVTSGYRSSAVNRAVHGSPTSQHMRGEAADIKVEGVAADVLAAAIVALGVPFDQVIWYDIERGGHVHVSYSIRRARRQVLHAPATGGYTPWTP